MHKYVVTLMASLLSCSAAFAFWPEAADSSLELGVGYRRDKLEWRTSAHIDSSYSGDSYSNSDIANLLPLGVSSRLKWRDLNIWQIEARGTYITCDNIYLRGNADYGWITHGKNTDSDFLTFSNNDESRFEFAHSRSKVKGHVYDAELAVGYQFKLCDDNFSIAPLIGYSWNGQHLRDNHLRQSFYTILEDEPAPARAKADSSYYYYYTYGSCSSDSYSSSSGRRHSKYHARWNGPFLGFDFDYRFGCGCEWDVFGTYEFHWARYHAKGRWFLRDDLHDGFHHRAKNAYGQHFNIGLKWDFCPCWTATIRGDFYCWWANRGRDRAKVAHGKIGNIKTDCLVSIPLHRVKWQSAGVTLDIGMVF